MTIIALLEEAQARLWEARPRPLDTAMLDDRAEIRGVAERPACWPASSSAAEIST